MHHRRVLVALVIAWACTRAIVGWYTVHDDTGPYEGKTPAASDIALYDFWAQQAATGARPYVEFDFGYPPADLALLAGPRELATYTGASFETVYVWLMLATDAVAMAGLGWLVLRGGNWWGAAAWVAFVPALGPVAYSRFDLVPAAALIWAIALAREGRWMRSGVSLAIAAGTKVFAGLLLPAWVFLVRRPIRFCVGFAAALLVPLLPFVDVPGSLFDNVVSAHGTRGVAVESTWGSLLLLGERLSGGRATIELRSGAWEIIDDSGSLLRNVSTLLVLGVAVHAGVIARRHRDAPLVPRLAVITASTVVLSVALGSILSAQYLLWCIAAVVVALAVGADVHWPTALVGTAAVATHAVYPFRFFDIIGGQGLPDVALLIARNALLLAAGALLLRQAIAPADTGPGSAPAGSDPAVEEDEPVPVLPGDR